MTEPSVADESAARARRYTDQVRRRVSAAESKLLQIEQLCALAEVSAAGMDIGHQTPGGELTLYASDIYGILGIPCDERGYRRPQ